MNITIVYYMAELTFIQNLIIQLYWEDRKQEGRVGKGVCMVRNLNYHQLQKNSCRVPTFKKNKEITAHANYLETESKENNS